ncbi:MAG: long-chain acyl-CoA synthetase [Actinomycetota bacterium]|jgi:long-chain acyl-CoA synthetase|nr:AMP-dependent synthetase and ligase [Cryptosporangiaceae bacterium]MDQ1677965.1 long-chain acyl-CoA synthetase [Actinomycetota bacterium]
MPDATAERQDIDETIAGRTLPSVFAELVAKHPDARTIRWRDADGTFRDQTLTEYRGTVRDAALGLVSLGFAPGEFGLVMASNRPEHGAADLGIIHARGASVTLYNTLAPDQVAWIAEHCGATVAIVESEEQLAKFRKVRHQLPNLRTIVTLDADPAGDEGVIRWTELLARGAAAAAADPGAFERSWRELKADDLLSLIYTSGTTGTPKGVMYSHRNVLWTAESIRRHWGDDMLGNSRLISYLPLAHVSERFTSHWGPLWQSLHVDTPGSITFCPDLTQLLPYLQETRPTVFVGVPRVWEKFQTAIRAGIAAQPEEIRTAVTGALDAGRRAAELRHAGQDIPAELAAAVEAAAPVYAGVRAKLGLDEVKLAVTTTAPTPLDLELFWAGLGLPLHEVWGMSELTGPATAVPPHDLRLGTVGPLLPGVEATIGADGELLIRGGNVMQGYYRDDERTAEALDADGWLHTGDIAVEDDGWYRIVDRKKELIITSSGKNIAPAQVESLLKLHPLVGQAITIGDQRSHLTALIVLDPDISRAWAAQRGIAGATMEELAQHPDVVAAIAAGVSEANTHLARIEQVKRFSILPREWTPESGELTPTQKLKRRVVLDRYATEIASLYAEPAGGYEVAPR